MMTNFWPGSPQKSPMASLCAIEPLLEMEKRESVRFHFSLSPLLKAARGQFVCLAFMPCTALLSYYQDNLDNLTLKLYLLQGYQEALSHYPDDPELLLSLGTMFHAMGNLDEALDVYMEVREIDPNNEILQTNLSRLLSQASKTSLSTLEG